MRIVTALIAALLASLWFHSRSPLLFGFQIRWGLFDWTTFYLMCFGASWVVLKVASSAGRKVFRPLLRRRVLIGLAGVAGFVPAYLLLAPYWYVFLITGAILLLAGWLLPVDMIMPNIPTVWNEEFIRGEIFRFRGDHSKLLGYLSSLYERFIIRQNDATARQRIAFLKTVIEGLKLTKEMEGAVDDLRFHGLEREIRELKLKLEKGDLESKAQMGRRVGELEYKRDRLKVKVEIARLTAELRNLKNPPPRPEVKPTPEEEKARKHAASAARIAALRQQKEEAQKITDPEERLKTENAIDNAIEREREEWARTL